MIIKPKFINLYENLINILKSKDIELITSNKLLLTINQAERFYSIHKDRVFFKDLIQYMTSGESIFLIVEGNIDKAREILGNTDPVKAQEGSIRQK